MRKQPVQASSSNSTLSEHPNASKRLNYYLPMNLHSTPNTSTAVNTPAVQSTNHINTTTTPISNGNGNNHINGNNGGNNNNGNGNGHGQSPEDPVANYTLQGVMQWLNGEYRRYERERNAWEIERANLVVLDRLICFGLTS